MKEIKKPLENRNIILTRAKDQVSNARNLFQNAGAKIFDLPALIIDYPDDLRPIDNALKEINNFNWIIFSSTNGIKFLENRLLTKGLCLKECLKKVKVAVVGEKTSQYLKSLGIKADYVPPNFIAESLIDNFPVELKGLRIFIPRVQSGGRNIIIDNCLNKGAFVSEVAVYESKCPDSIPKETVHAFQNNIIDAIVFSSGKTVINTSFLLQKHFGKEWQKMLEEVNLLTIGPQTSLACKKIFGRVDKQAIEYTFEGLLEASIRVFN